MKNDRLKEIRLSADNVEVRADENEPTKMIIEGYPVVFDKEVLINSDDGSWYEKIDSHAFDNADMKDVALKYAHSDDFFIMARTRNKSLTLSVDEKGLFMHAELIPTSNNKDVYEMVKSGLLTEGSFAFTVADDIQEVIDGYIHRNITAVDKLFDVSICPNGAYGSFTEIYARSFEALESVQKMKLESEKRVKTLRERNRNRVKLLKEETK